MLLLVLLVLALLFGGWGRERYGDVGFGPFGRILLILWLTGNL